MNRIAVEHLSFSYPQQPVLEDISFSVPQGSVLCVLGPNGVGKSTLFRCMLGLLADYQGDILLDNRSISDMEPPARARLAAYVPQSHVPVFGYTVLDVVLMGTFAQNGWLRSPGAKQRTAAREALDRVGIASLSDRDYTRISGGERQLVLIARALAQQTGILMMDEPTANLDYGNQLRILEQIVSLASEGYSIVLSTHHPEQAFLYAGQVLALLDGRVLCCGPPNELVTAELMLALYGVEVEIERLHDDRFRVCIPKAALRRPPNGGQG